MIQIHITKACAHLCSPPELLTAGMAKAVSVRFAFSKDWDGLTKTAVFTNRKKTVDVLESEWDGNRLIVPYEILADAGLIARVGVYGSNASGVVLPTVWVTLGKVQPAAEPSGDLDDLRTYNKDNLVAAINEARQSGGGSGGGYNIGSGLKLDAETNTLSVDTAESVEKDNTKPVTSAAVYTEVGNINALLATI